MGRIIIVVFNAARAGARVRTGVAGAAVAAVLAVVLVQAGPATAATPVTVNVTVSAVDNDGDGSLASAPFSTSVPNELVVVFFSSDGPNNSTVPPQLVEEVTGCGLSWQEIGQANEVAGNVAVYTALATAPVSNCQVNGTLRYDYDGMVTVVSFTAASPEIGNRWPWSQQSDNGFGTVDIDVDGSLVYQVGHNWSAAAEPFVNGIDASSPPENVPASLVASYLSPVGDTSYVARIDQPLLAEEPGSGWRAGLVAFFPQPGLINAFTIVVQPA